MSTIEERLSALSISPASSSDDSATALKTYLFKPKGSDAKLVLVCAEHDKDIGKASALAKSIGVKDMRSAEEDYVKEVLGVGKAEGGLHRAATELLQCV